MKSNRLAVIAMLFLACANPPSAAPVTETKDMGPRVIFPDRYVVKVEIAADEESRAQGLMYRDQVRAGTGMLFFFPQDDEYPFWMKNTMVPLDMIWIDSAKKIVHVEHDVPPCKVENCPNYPPHAIARYVLEVAGGVTKQHRLKNGDVLRFEATENVTPR